MARSNYSHAKRLKEIARQKRQEEKRLRRQARAAAGQREEGPEGRVTETTGGNEDSGHPAGPGNCIRSG